MAKQDKSKKQPQHRDLAATLPEEKPWYKKPLQLAIIVFVLIATYISFSPALTPKKQFTNWDDIIYITNQPLIQELSVETIKIIFNPQKSVMGNYQPFTMLSFSLNYYFSKLSVKPYMQTNLFIHLLSTLLVFVFLYRLSQKKFWIGVIGALWFGIHPMHVESVAWITERKDVLYAFFFLLSCIAYLNYVDAGKRSGLLWAFVFFIFSCLSKAMAVPLVLVLALIDFYRGRKINVKVVSEKFPFFIVALLVGINAVITQSHEGTVAEFQTFTVMQRILFAAHGFIFYIWKLIAPLNLSAFYPYPALETGSFPFIYILSPIIALAVIIVPLLILKKDSDKENLKVFVFGFGFFIVMILPVLQFLTVGIAATADRYSYVSYIGLLFIIGTFIQNAFQKKQLWLGTAVVTVGFSIFLMANCYNRVSVWNNSEALWTDVIENYPFKEEYAGKNIQRISREGIATAYKNRASYYREKDMMDKAFEDYSVVTKANPHDAGAFLNLGNIYALQKQFDKVLEMYSKAIEADSFNIDAYANRGMTYSLLGQYEKAVHDLDKALALAPNNAAVLEKMAHVQMKLQHYDETVSICDKLIERNSATVNTFLFRGMSYAAMHKTNEATADLEKVVSMQPGNAYAWAQLMNLFYETQQFEAARNAADQAASLGYPVDGTFLAELETKVK